MSNSSKRKIKKKLLKLITDAKTSFPSIIHFKERKSPLEDKSRNLGLMVISYVNLAKSFGISSLKSPFLFLIN